MVPEHALTISAGILSSLAVLLLLLRFYMLLRSSFIDGGSQLQLYEVIGGLSGSGGGAGRGWIRRRANCYTSLSECWKRSEITLPSSLRMVSLIPPLPLIADRSTWKSLRLPPTNAVCSMSVATWLQYQFLCLRAERAVFLRRVR